jgi:hypothetical protein
MSRPFPLLRTAESADLSVLDAALVDFDHAVQVLIGLDPEPHGRFSRAYVTAIFRACLAPRLPGPDAPRGRPDPQIVDALKGWIKDQLQEHVDEVRDPRLAAARRAAHGFWLQSLAVPLDEDGRPSAERMLDELLALTRPE